MCDQIAQRAGEVRFDAPWYCHISGEQWRVFWAAFLGWLVDAFDFNILPFILIDIQRSFTVDRALAGALGTVTLLTRVFGGVLAGTAADKFGRKLPLMVSILWFSLFAFLSGFSRSYAMLFALRALFGIGMGGEWAAGMPLALEHWPVRFRGHASGMLQSAWAWGYLLAAAAFQFIYPIFRGSPDLQWRAMFWLAIAPAFLTLWIRAGVPESPVWLEHQRRLQAARLSHQRIDEPVISLVRIFRRDLLGTTIQTTAVLSALMCGYFSAGFWYATLLRDAGRLTLPYLIAFNLGAIAGYVGWGRLSETRLGRRGVLTIAAPLGVATIPLYLYATSQTGLSLGALMMGACGSGIFGIAPAYVTERFPTAARGVGPGFSYHAAAVVGSVMPVLIGAMQDHGMLLANAMTVGIAASLVTAVALIWLGPETRGRSFNET
jgi:MFS transporter, SHS family, lactate transporter